MAATGYVRFVTYDINAHSLTWQGVFHAVTDLKYREELEAYVYDWLDHDLEWLNEHLAVPPCFREQDVDEAVCWFHPRAHEPISRVRSLAAALDEHGVRVRMIRSCDPGRVIYEDRWQIVAAPRPPIVWHRRNPRGRRSLTW